MSMRSVRFKDIGGLLKHLVGRGFQGGPQACVVYRLMPVDGLAGDLSESQPEQKASGGPGSSVFAETVFARGGPLPMTCGVWTSRTFERPEARCI
jgi:hypothetical protein